MSILKTKIAKLHRQNGRGSPEAYNPKIKREDFEAQNEEKEVSLLTKSDGECKNSTNLHKNGVFSSAPRGDSSKNNKKECTSINIMKNYCRGIINFVLSPIALKYLNPLLHTHEIDPETFRKFIRSRKSKINCIKQLRKALLPVQEDTLAISILKVIFKEITIVFLKFFAPNWIYNSKISDKYAHLKYRFKILRRVRNPEHFTYLHGFEKTGLI